MSDSGAATHWVPEFLLFGETARNTSGARLHVSRELLLTTCTSLKACFEKLSKQAADERFEELCARVVANGSASEVPPPAAGLSASAKTSAAPRLVVPTGRKPLDLFDHTVWQKMDPVTWWYNDCVWAHPRRPRPIAMEKHHDMCMRKEELEYSTPEEVERNEVYNAPMINRLRDLHRQHPAGQPSHHSSVA